MRGAGVAGPHAGHGYGHHRAAAAGAPRGPCTGGEQTLAATEADYRQPAGSLKVRTVDKESGAPLVARISITSKGGKFHALLAALYRIERGNGHFYCRDAAELRLPAG